jgi:hypothetical protein
MKKPSIYLDTNVFSNLHVEVRGAQSLLHRTLTREWWNVERLQFRLYASLVAEKELRQGNFRGQAKAVSACRRLPYLPVTKLVLETANHYVDCGLIPEEKLGDSLQLAIATIHSVDYLLTWNYAHLANVDTQRKLTMINGARQLRTPLLVSPESIPKSALGQDIHRRRDE